VARLFDALAPDYDQSGVAFFGPIAQLLVDALAPAPGERCLDVGCGRGAVSRLLLDRVGPTGDVLGVDLSRAMVDHATRDVPGARFQVADASVPPTGPWDVVASGLVLFFLPDPVAALRAWYGELRPGGRAGVTTFGPQDPVWASVDEVLQPYLPTLDPRSKEAMARFRTTEGVEQMLRDAGFADVATTTTELPVVFGDADQWWAFSVSTGQRRAWDAVPEGERAAVRARCVERLEGARQPDGSYRTSQQVRVTTGVRPA
jgi:trans-aconitate methyltransferase